MRQKSVLYGSVLFCWGGKNRNKIFGLDILSLQVLYDKMKEDIIFNIRKKDKIIRRSMQKMNRRIDRNIYLPKDCFLNLEGKINILFLFQPNRHYAKDNNSPDRIKMKALVTAFLFPSCLVMVRKNRNNLMEIKGFRFYHSRKSTGHTYGKESKYVIPSAYRSLRKLFALISSGIQRKYAIFLCNNF